MALSTTPSSNHNTALAWLASATSGIAGYNVYKAATCSGTFAAIGQTANLGFTDSAVTAGATACYQVTAYDGSPCTSNCESIASNQATATTPWFQPSPANSLVLTVSGNKLSLSWLYSYLTGTDPASGFDVWRGTTTGGPYSKLTTLTGLTVTSYSDSTAVAGTTYFYVVTTWNPGGDSTYSNEVSGVVPFQAPSAPVSLTAIAK